MPKHYLKIWDLRETDISDRVAKPFFVLSIFKVAYGHLNPGAFLKSFPSTIHNNT